MTVGMRLPRRTSTTARTARGSGTATPVGVSAGSRPRLTEEQFLRLVLDLAALNHWVCYHTHNSLHSARGFPDLVMVRGGRLLICELKTDTGRTTPEQDLWAAELRAVPAPVEYHCWRPGDWTAIQETLARAGRTGG